MVFTGQLFVMNSKLRLHLLFQVCDISPTRRMTDVDIGNRTSVKSAHRLHGARQYIGLLASLLLMRPVMSVLLICLCLLANSKLCCLTCATSQTITMLDDVNRRWSCISKAVAFQALSPAAW